MMQRFSRLAPFLFSIGLLSAVGFGCSPAVAPSTTSNTQPSGPKPADFSNSSPADATKKIALTPGSIFTIHQSFSGPAATLAAARGWGQDTTREVVVKNFAPGNFAAVEWKLNTTVTSTQGKAENKQFTGALAGLDLKTAHDLLFPIFWKSDVGVALQSSGIWLSTDLYEDLAKGHRATLDPDFFTKAMSVTDTLPKATQDAFQKLVNDTNKELVHHDVYETVSDIDLVNLDLNLNGQRTTVQALHATNWFGQYYILANAQYPIILKFVPSDELVRVGLDRVLAFEVTDISQLQQ